MGCAQFASDIRKGAGTIRSQCAACALSAQQYAFLASDKHGLYNTKDSCVSESAWCCTVRQLHMSCLIYRTFKPVWQHGSRFWADLRFTSTGANILSHSKACLIEHSAQPLSLSDCALLLESDRPMLSHQPNQAATQTVFRPAARPLARCRFETLILSSHQG